MECKLFNLSLAEVSSYESGYPPSDYTPESGAFTYQYYQGIESKDANIKRVRSGGFDSRWWLRSPDTDTPTGMPTVYSNGHIGGENLYSVYAGPSPACVLPSSTKLKLIDGETNKYNIVWDSEPEPTPESTVIENVPSQNGTLTYNKSSQTPTWNNYDSSQLDLSVTAQTNAGTYSASFTPKSGYTWSDGTTEAKSVNWSISKAEGTLSMSGLNGPGFVNVPINSTKAIYAAEYQGPISMSVDDSSIATASMEENTHVTSFEPESTITITGVAVGSCNITVTAGGNSNYNSATRTVRVYVE